MERIAEALRTGTRSGSQGRRCVSKPSRSAQDRRETCLDPPIPKSTPGPIRRAFHLFEL